MPLVRDQFSPSTSTTTVAVSWDNAQKDAINNLRSFASSFSDGLLYIPQAIITGSNTNGVANFLIAGTGLQAVISASGATPVIVCSSGGFDAQGLVCYHSRIITNTNIVLSASTTNFCFIDYNVGTGVVSAGAVTTAPTYSNTAPTSPTTASYWFNPVSMTMFNWNGSSWIKKQTVFIGEVVTNVSAVTSAITYALKDTQQRVQALTALNTQHVLSHNFGTNQLRLGYHFICTSDDAGHVSGDVVHTVYSTGSANSGCSIYFQGRNSLIIRTGAASIGSVINPTNGVLSAMTIGRWDLVTTTTRLF